MRCLNEFPCTIKYTVPDWISFRRTFLRFRSPFIEKVPKPTLLGPFLENLISEKFPEEKSVLEGKTDRNVVCYTKYPNTFPVY